MKSTEIETETEPKIVDFETEWILEKIVAGSRVRSMGILLGLLDELKRQVLAGEEGGTV